MTAHVSSVYGVCTEYVPEYPETSESQPAGHFTRAPTGVFPHTGIQAPKLYS